MKVCGKCKESLDLSEFYRNRSCPDGLQKWCKKCCKQTDAKRVRPYNAEVQKRYKAKRSEYYRRRCNEDQFKNSLRESRRTHYLKNKEDYFARAAARMSRTKKASVIHDDPNNVSAIYKLAANMRAQGKDVQVDHIIPLNGVNVSGLHVSWNLRIVPSAENRAKGNKFGE
jgi:hypothetical protein